MRVQLIAHTPDPERLIAASAKVCYSDVGAYGLYEGLDEEKTQAFIKRLSDMGHESPTEHATYTFALEGVSRAFLAQITRHRIASFSVSSQRYVKAGEPNYYIPDAIKKDLIIEDHYKTYIEEAYRHYHEIAWKLYNIFKNEGMNEREADKKAIENARYLLPNAACTNMVVTMNARELMHFFSLRCCNRAQDEIRDVADEMLKQCREVSPQIFKNAGPACIRGKCPEGKMTCGRPRMELKIGD